uniref:Uncharacterized protein n=1 Tax=Arundo donax TaxID=35708 RepID=A0A0A9F891_ARUDO
MAIRPHPQKHKIELGEPSYR